MVEIVMPDTGLFEEPTSPAMYPLTEENTNPAITMMTAIRERNAEVVDHRVGQPISADNTGQHHLHRQVPLRVRDACGGAGL